MNHKDGKSGSSLVSDRSAPDLSPDLSPKYMVTVGTRWYLLGLAAAPLYQRVPTSPNSHKHFQDSNSLGGTTKPQVTGLKFPVVCLESGDKACPSERHAAGKAAGQRPFRSIPPHLVAQKSLLLRIGLRRFLLSDLSPDLSPDFTGRHTAPPPAARRHRGHVEVSCHILLRTLHNRC